MNNQILQLLSSVIHPESGRNIVDLGLVEGMEITQEKIALSLRFKKPHDPFANTIKQQCERRLGERFPNLDVDITVAFPEAKPVQKVQKPMEKLPQRLDNVKHIIAVVSGKGGVGKSTISANLAVSLAQKGYKVGLVDADIYGPSIPKMFGVEGEKPLTNEQEQLLPVEKYGVKMLSIGFFLKPDDPLIWRAPMATSALKQLMLQAAWGALDFMVVDMPPGTGDIHLTLVQELQLSGAVVVSTPQQVALADALRGINMLRSESVNVRILGLVENMAWFTPAELPHNRYYIFGRGGTKKLAVDMHLPLLGEIPLVQSVCDSGDSGTPAALREGAAKQAFAELTEKVLRAL
jgi:ATP-binding protein involved in chromosome partitioning